MQTIIFAIGFFIFVSAIVEGIDRASKRRSAPLEDMDIMYRYVGGMLLMIASLFF
jgi:hypothetical protein